MTGVVIPREPDSRPIHGRPSTVCSGDRLHVVHPRGAAPRDTDLTFQRRVPGTTPTRSFRPSTVIPVQDGTVETRSGLRRRTFLWLGASLVVLAALPRAIRSVRARFFRHTIGPTLTPDDLATVSVLADALLPRTTTPGALDVGVPAFVALMNKENYGPPERDQLAEALTLLDDTAMRVASMPFRKLSGDALARVMQELEMPSGKPAPRRGYLQLRRLVLFGYFTSETVQRDVLRTVMIPGRFDGAVPLASGAPNVHG